MSHQFDESLSETEVAPEAAATDPALDPVLSSEERDYAEDLRRAEPNPPQTVARTDDPNTSVDLGYMEDREAEHDAEELRSGIEASAVDPLEADRKVEQRPGPSAGPLPGDAP
ncbi:hypothetical protein [Candidatus Dormiibacter inghamiae]|uniref:hypothetical protein n=1 Tax=Candidatus Dormiibacter inghamiae TaxID=3127013 RepID=UPI001A1C3A94|nr:hypothetical protein [Candidatus Dormibacteraeota bacterium]